jgi:hypothetical protein
MAVRKLCRCAFARIATTESGIGVGWLLMSPGRCTALICWLSILIDPAITKAIRKQIIRHASENTFKAIALEWHSKNTTTWADSTANNIKRYLEKDIFPWLGNRAIKDITAPDLLAVLRKIESRGAHEKAQRCREYAGQVLRYAIATGRAERVKNKSHLIRLFVIFSLFIKSITYASHFITSHHV